MTTANDYARYTARLAAGDIHHGPDGTIQQGPKPAHPAGDTALVLVSGSGNSQTVTVSYYDSEASALYMASDWREIDRKQHPRRYRAAFTTYAPRSEPDTMLRNVAEIITEQSDPRGKVIDPRALSYRKPGHYAVWLNTNRAEDTADLDALPDPYADRHAMQIVAILAEADDTGNLLAMPTAEAYERLYKYISRHMMPDQPTVCAGCGSTDAPHAYQSGKHYCDDCTKDIHPDDDQPTA